MRNTIVAMDTSKLIHITHFLCVIIFITEADAFIQSDLQVRDTEATSAGLWRGSREGYKQARRRKEVK